MAVPKRRKSRSKTHSRRAHWKASTPDLVSIVVNGQRMLVPPRLVQAYRRFGPTGRPQ